MSALEKLAEQINGIPSPQEYVIQMASVILKRNGLTPDDLSSHLEVYGTRCSELLKALNYSQLPTVVAELEQRAREAKLSQSRPSEAILTAVKETIYSHGRAQGWVPAELDAAEKMAGPSRIRAISWRGVTTEDGREIDRSNVRASLRYAAYDEERWQKYLSSLPPIAAPSEEPR